MMNLTYTNDGYFDVIPKLEKDGNNRILKTIDNFCHYIRERPGFRKLSRVQRIIRNGREHRFQKTLGRSRRLNRYGLHREKI